MLTTFLLRKKPTICKPKTFKVLEDGPRLDNNLFLKLVRNLEMRPKSRDMFTRLYRECESIIYHHGYTNGILGLDSSILIEEDVCELMLYKENHFFSNESIMSLDYKDEYGKKHWEMYAAYYDKEFLPCRLQHYDGDSNLTFEHYYLD